MGVLGVAATSQAEIPTALSTGKHFSINDLCAIVHCHEGEHDWFIGYITHRQSGESYCVEYLKRVNEEDTRWQYRDPPEECEVHGSQIVQIVPRDIWDLKDIRQTRFVLENYEEIRNMNRK